MCPHLPSRLPLFVLAVLLLNPIASGQQPATVEAGAGSTRPESATVVTPAVPATPIAPAAAATLAGAGATVGWAIAIHGGAGNGGDELKPHRAAAYHAGLRRALAAGTAVLGEGGSALDAVEEAVRTLENDPLFNAGRGAVMTIEGTFELDASIMDGSNLRTGAVAGIRTASNPISVARRVMDRTDHVLLVGPPADRFAVDQGFGSVTPEYFFTPRYFEAVQQRRAELGLPPLDNPARRPSEGTVGAVARDIHGNLAAATSTGGRSGKMSGRVGDSPIAGAGNYAENGVAAISSTGIGEQFIRHSAAAQVAWFVKHAGLTLEQASHKVMFEILKPNDGGMIVLGPEGPPVFQFSTAAMSRGMADSSGQVVSQLGPAVPAVPPPFPE
jgi:beta-aspartyl-peptidase (threonine type)